MTPFFVPKFIRLVKTQSENLLLPRVELHMLFIHPFYSSDQSHIWMSDSD